MEDLSASGTQTIPVKPIQDTGNDSDELSDDHSSSLFKHAVIVSDEDCFNPEIQTLNDLTIRSPDDRFTFLSGGGDFYLSDDQLQAGWYKTSESFRMYTMIDENNKPNLGKCSTYWPVYLKGTHPDVTKLPHKTPVNATACITYGNYECDINYNIQIRRCGPILQYYLQPTILFAAYCFSDYGTACRDKTAAPTDVDFGEVFVSSELHHEDEKIDGIVKHRPYFKLRCHFKAITKWKYAVNWYVDGKFLTSYGAVDHDALDELTLHEDMIDRLGVEVHCGVRASNGHCGQQTDITSSKAFYAGIEILNTTITLQKGNRGSIEMKVTVPIGCYYDKNSDVSTTCREHVRIFDPKESGHKCTNGGLANIRVDSQQCATDVKSLQKGKTWNPNQIYTFDIATIDENYDDQTTFILKLAFDNTIGHKKWRNFTFPDIRVNIYDTSSYKQKICYSHVDPHMRTSDKYYYEHQDEEGLFILYRNDKYGIEVQEKIIDCAYNAKCACAVAVRAGQDVFMINICGDINFLGFTHCGDGGILQVVKKNDNLYEVFTPIGTKITIQLLYGHFMNIDITMAPKDIRNTVGLCGYFDDDVSNDFRHKDKKTNTPLQRYPTPFTKNWKVLEDESLLKPGIRNLTSWSDQNGFYCICSRSGDETVALCAPTQYLNCIKPGSITPKKCRIMGRKKRNAVHNNTKEMERLFTLMNSEKKRRRIKREEPQSISTEEARVLCTNKIKGSLAVTNYGEVSGNEDPDAVVDQCIYDVEVGNDEAWANVHVESVNNIVKGMLDLEPTYVINNSEQVETFLMNTCPGNCSSNGNCTKLGHCSCNTFYHGATCTIDERDPLVIDDIEGGGLCDLADGDECACFTIRSDNLLNGFKCKIQITLYFINGTKHQSMANIEEGDYEDVFTGVCCDNGVILSENEHVFGRVYDVSISNDGGAYSNIETVDVLNSVCQEIVTGAQPPFRLKNQTCFIDGLCYLDGDVAYKQTTACLSCESSVEAYDWTEKPCPTTTTVSTTSLVLTSVESTKNTSTTTSTSVSTTAETSIPSTTTKTTETSSVGNTSSPETSSLSTTTKTTETSSVGNTSSPETSILSTTTKTTETSSVGNTSSPETSILSTTTKTTETSSVGNTSSPETRRSSTTSMTTKTISVGNTSSPETSSLSTTSMTTETISVANTSSSETSSPSTTSTTTETSSVGNMSSPETRSSSTTSMTTKTISVGNTSPPETSSQSATTVTTETISVGSTSSPETSSPSTRTMVTETSSVGKTSSPETSSPSTTSKTTETSSVGNTSSPETRSQSTRTMATETSSVGNTSSPETSSQSTTTMTTETINVGSTSSPETSSPSTTSKTTETSSVGSTSSPEISIPSTTSMTLETSSVRSDSAPETSSPSTSTVETDTSSFATTPSKTPAPEALEIVFIIGLFIGVPVIVTVVAAIIGIVVVSFKKTKSSAMKWSKVPSGHVATHGSFLDRENRSFYFENLLNKDYKGHPVAQTGHFNVEGHTFSTSGSSQSFGDLSTVSIDFKN